MVRRVYVEKKEALRQEAAGLLNELRTLLGLTALKGLRLINRYDVEGLDEETFQRAVQTVFSEPQVDNATAALPAGDYVAFAVEYLPGQFDQRADSASQCIQLMTQGDRPTVRTAKVYLLEGTLTEADLAALAPEKSAIAYSEGFTVSVKTDGSKVVTYDGEHGDQMLTAYLVPDFDAVVAGKWEQSWTLQYEDLSLYWAGDAELFDPRLTLTGFRLSPLSWSADFTATEDVPEGETLNFNLIPRDWGVQLRHRDGSLTDQPLHWGVGSGSSPVPNEAGLFVTVITVGNVFDQPIDLSDITAVIIDGQEFPVS